MYVSSKVEGIVPCKGTLVGDHMITHAGHMTSMQGHPSRRSHDNTCRSHDFHARAAYIHIMLARKNESYI